MPTKDGNTRTDRRNQVNGRCNTSQVVEQAQISAHLCFTICASLIEFSHVAALQISRQHRGLECLVVIIIVAEDWPLYREQNHMPDNAMTAV